MKTTFGLALAIASVAASSFAQPAQLAPGAAPPPMPLTVHSLRDGVYFVTGGVSNAGFIVGQGGVIAVDPQKFVPAAREEQADIAKITGKPVNVMIVTHADPDHVNGLPGWPMGMQIISHENARAEILANLGDTNPADSPPPPEVRDYLPNRTFRFSEDAVLDGVRVRLIHVAPAHTDGDTVVYLPDQKVVFAGDLITPLGPLPYPILHVGTQGVLNKRGSSLGWIRSMRAILALDADIYVSGHGPNLSKAELVKRVDATEARRARIKAMFDKGMTLDQIKAALNDPPATGIEASFPTFTETTYFELTYQ